MKQIIFASKTVENVDMKKLHEILTISKANNIKSGVTGLLVFDGKHFLACSEGEVEVVDEILQRVLKDCRHTNITILGEQNITFREFSSWSMSFLNKSEELKSLISKITGYLDFNPFDLHYLKAKKLLLELETII